MHLAICEETFYDIMARKEKGDELKIGLIKILSGTAFNLHLHFR
jgi:hypothetical protein